MTKHLSFKNFFLEKPADECSSVPNSKQKQVRNTEMTEVRSCMGKRWHIDRVEHNSAIQRAVAINNMSLILFWKEKSKNYGRIWGKKEWKILTKNRNSNR